MAKAISKFEKKQWYRVEEGRLHYFLTWLFRKTLPVVPNVACVKWVSLPVPVVIKVRSGINSSAPLDTPVSIF